MNDFGGKRCSDAAARDPIENDDVRVPEKKEGLVFNDGDHGERGVGRSDVPMKFLYRASAPAHRRVKESPLSSDAIFKQVFLIRILILSLFEFGGICGSIVGCCSDSASDGRV